MPRKITDNFCIQPDDVVVSSHGNALPGGAANSIVPDGFEYWFFGPPGTWLSIPDANRIERCETVTRISVSSVASGLIQTPIYVYEPGEIYPDYLLSPPDDKPPAGPGYSYIPPGEELITEAMQKIKPQYARKGEIVRVIFVICPSVEERQDKKLIVQF